MRGKNKTPKCPKCKKSTKPLTPYERDLYAFAVVINRGEKPTKEQVITQYKQWFESITKIFKSESRCRCYIRTPEEYLKLLEEENYE